MDGCLWMHMDTVSLGLDFRDRLEWDQVFRLELMLGDGTRVVCFFLETWVLFVLSLFYIWSPYQIHHLQVVSYIQFTIFLICESLILWWLSWSSVCPQCGTLVWSLGWEDTLEKEMTNHSSTIAKKIPWMEEPGGLQSMESQRVGHD